MPSANEGHFLILFCWCKEVRALSAIPDAAAKPWWPSSDSITWYSHASVLLQKAIETMLLKPPPKNPDMAVVVEVMNQKQSETHQITQFDGHTGQRGRDVLSYPLMSPGLNLGLPCKQVTRQREQGNCSLNL